MPIEQLAARDFNGTELLNARLHNLASDPGATDDGLIIYRTDTDKVRACIAGVWKDLATMDDVTAGGISSTIVDAKGDLIVATAADTVAREAVGSDGTFYVADSAQGTGHTWRTIASGDLPADGVTHAKYQNIATDRLLGRDTAASGDPEELTVGGGIEFTGSGGIQTSALTGDVTKSAGDTSTTIASGAVINTKLADMAQSTIKGRAEGAGTGAPVDLSIAQVKAILDYTGTDVAFTPAQGIAATNIQAAIEEAITDLTTLIGTTIEARKWKDPVDAATTAALPAVTYNSGAGTLTADANGALAAQDGVTLGVGDSLLVKNQTNTFEDGLYDVTQVGSGAAPFILTRRADGSTAGELSDATVIVEGGTVGQGDIYTQTAALTNLTSDAQTWAKTGEGNTTYTADGTTIELVGNSFRIASGAAGSGLTGGGGSALDVNVGSGLDISGDAVRIAAAAAGAGLTGGAGSALAVGDGAGITVNADDVAVNVGAGLEISSDAVRIAAAAAGAGLTGGAGSALAVGAGTGITVNADDVAINTSVVARKATGALTGGGTSEVLTHNLGTRDVVVAVRNHNSPYEEVDVEKEATSTNTVTIRAASTLPSNYTWVVVG